MGSFVSLTLEMRKLYLTGVKQAAQGHTSEKGLRRDGNTGPPDSKFRIQVTSAPLGISLVRK